MWKQENTGAGGYRWMLAVAAGTGVAAAVVYGWRLARHGRSALAPPVEPQGLRAIEDEAIAALEKDDVAGSRAIDVAAIGPGIIELTGMVESAGEARRAVDVAETVSGVHTVLNRLAVGDVEAHLRETRLRRLRGDAPLEERRWYGIGAGMGRRRQGRQTDPGRRDDRADRVSRRIVPDEAPLAESVNEPRDAGESLEQSGP